MHSSSLLFCNGLLRSH